MGFGPPDFPDIVTEPPHGKVLVVAPHPDDEIMGPGGTLLLHARANDPIAVIVVCDGSLGDPDAHYDPGEYPTLREAETRRNAKKYLGTEDIVFFRFADGVTEDSIDDIYPDLPPDPDDKRRALVHGLSTHLKAQIVRVLPRIIYYPWVGEFHADHWGTGAAVANLVRNEPELFEGVSLLGYEVWSTVVPETLVDVTSCFADKLAAIQGYETQNRYVDYGTVVGGLNRYRGMLVPGPGDHFAEAFVGRYRSEEAS